MNIENNKIKKENTDPKPYICYLNGNLDFIIQSFLNKIKPIKGIIKYKMVSWEDFPSNQEEAKLMSKKWIEYLHNSKLYDNLKITIYFHLDKKTIRFELKEKNQDIINLESEENVENIITQYDYNINNNVIFKCEKTNYFDNYDFERCKITGKKISEELEKKYILNKFLVFLNINKKIISIKKFKTS